MSLSSHIDSTWLVSLSVMTTPVIQIGENVMVSGLVDCHAHLVEEQFDEDLHVRLIERRQGSY